ncbi:protein translocase subunit SecD [Patescibacteria group bacterium]
MKNLFKNIYKFLTNNAENISSAVLIIAIAVVAGSIVWPQEPAFLNPDTRMHLGLDLQGGVQITYKADLRDIDKGSQEDAMSSLVEVINRRVDALGVAEPNIQSTTFTDGNKGIIVELPGINDVNQALEVIGKTANLDFREILSEQAQEWEKTDLAGKHLKKAQVTFPENSTEPQISISFNNEGKKLFSEITERNIQKPLAIFLDDQLISAPTVQGKITAGQAVITGEFTIESANELAIQLNAGALPVPVEVAEQKTIGATLGESSIKQSVLAGLIGIVLVAIFMIAVYKISGLAATLALAIYGLIALALFKIIPVTMTLAGIAGFILSLGMAVDANVLIFERLKEEVRAGETLRMSIENGFSRAWTSIRDSNISTLIIALILFWFGTGVIKGFALTLSIGILVSMFSAIVITRSILRILASNQKLNSKAKWFY